MLKDITCRFVLSRVCSLDWDIMKTVIAVAFLVALVVSEPPPSNSYLPPPPASRGGGYTQANQAQGNLPQVVAARNLEFGRDLGALGHGSAANGFARNNLQVSAEGHGASRSSGARSAFGAPGPNARAQPRFNDQANDKQGYDQNAAALGRNALEEANVEPASYNFGYMVNDFQEGTEFGHHEERQEERAQGEYHVVLPDGRKQTVSYEADARGFKPQISYEDTDDLTRSGYDSNANNFRADNDGGFQGRDSGLQGHDSGFQSHDSGYHGNEQNGRSQNGGFASGRANGYN